MFTPQKLAREIWNDLRSGWYKNIFYEKTSAIYIFAENAFGDGVSLQISEVTLGKQQGSWFFTACIRDDISHNEKNLIFDYGEGRNSILEFIEDLFERCTTAQCCTNTGLAFA